MPAGNATAPLAPVAPPPSAEESAVAGGVHIHLGAPPARAKRQPRAVPPSAPELPPAPVSGFEDFIGRLAASEGLQGAGRTELEMRLHRLDETNGFEKYFWTGKTIRLTAEDVANAPHVDLDTEALKYAESCGNFGTYRWTLKGWEDGLMVLDTTRRVNLDQPPGFKAAAESVAPAAEPKQDPMEAAIKLANLAKMLGGGDKGTDPMLIESIRGTARAEGFEAGKTTGKLEASEDWRTRCEDREREAEKKGYERGKSDGYRDAKDEFQTQIHELEKDQEKPESVVGEVIGAIGGPDNLQRLVGAFLNKSEAPRRAPMPRPMQPPGAPGMPIRPQALPPANVQPFQPPVQQNTAPVQQNAPTMKPNPEEPEPTRAEHHKAMEALGYALGLMEDALEDNPNEQAEALRDGLKVLQDQGLVEGPLAVWWKQWREIMEHEVSRITIALEKQLGLDEEEIEPERKEEDTVAIAALKSLLKQRLMEGVEPDAIVKELGETVPPDTASEWRGMVKNMPRGMVLGYLGIPDEFKVQANVVLDRFAAE